MCISSSAVLSPNASKDRRPKVVPLNIFYGAENYLVDRAKEKALVWPDREITFLDGKDSSEDEVVSAMDQMLLGDDGLSVVLENAEKVKLKGALIEYLASRPSGSASVLTALLRTDKLPKAWADISSRGRVVHYEKCKTWDEKGIQKRLEDEAKRIGLILDEDAFSVLFKVHAEDILGSVNELNKLRFIVGKDKRVTKKIVLSVCSRQVSVMPWDVSDAAGLKQRKKALNLAGLLFKYEGEGASVPIVASMQKTVERLLLARTLEDGGYSGKEVAQAMGLNPFLYEKKYAPMVRSHTARSLKDQMKRLCELETRVKGPAPSKRTLVELAILSLAE